VRYLGDSGRVWAVEVGGSQISRGRTCVRQWSVGRSYGPSLRWTWTAVSYGLPLALLYDKVLVDGDPLSAVLKTAFLPSARIQQCPPKIKFNN